MFQSYLNLIKTETIIDEILSAIVKKHKTKLTNFEISNPINYAKKQKSSSFKKK